MRRKTLIATLTILAIALGVAWRTNAATASSVSFYRDLSDSVSVMAEVRDRQLRLSCWYTLPQPTGYVADYGETWRLGFMVDRGGTGLGTGMHIYRVWAPAWMVMLVVVGYPIVALIGAVRRWRRRHYGGVCRGCEYDLTGNLSGVCPECGRLVEHEVPAADAPRPVRSPLRRAWLPLAGILGVAALALYVVVADRGMARSPSGKLTTAPSTQARRSGLLLRGIGAAGRGYVTEADCMKCSAGAGLSDEEMLDAVRMFRAYDSNLTREALLVLFRQVLCERCATAAVDAALGAEPGDAPPSDDAREARPQPMGD